MIMAVIYKVLKWKNTVQGDYPLMADMYNGIVIITKTSKSLTMVCGKLLQC